jgi:hypothetical protein
MIERRANIRNRTFKTGVIVVPKSDGIDCVVRNLSPTGACIEVTGPHIVPDQFTLYVPKNKMLVPTQVVWKRDRRFGLEFSHQQEDPAAA